jgi:hypothetical protein
MACLHVACIAQQRLGTSGGIEFINAASRLRLREGRKNTGGGEEVVEATAGWALEGAGGGGGGGGGP